MAFELFKIDSKYHPGTSKFLSWPLHCSKSILNTNPRPRFYAYGYLNSLRSIPNTIPRVQNSFHSPWIAQNRVHISSWDFQITFMNLECHNISSEYHPKASKLLSWHLNSLKSIRNTIPCHQISFHGLWIAQNRFLIPSRSFKISFLNLEWPKIDSKYHPMLQNYFEWLEIDYKYHPGTSKFLSWSFHFSKSIPNTIPRLRIYFHGTWLAQNWFQIPSRGFKYPFMALELLKIDSK